MKAGESRKCVSLSLTRQQYLHLEALARQGRTSKAALARLAVERYLASALQGEALVSPQGQAGRSRWEEDDGA